MKSSRFKEDIEAGMKMKVFLCFPVEPRQPHPNPEMGWVSNKIQMLWTVRHAAATPTRGVIIDSFGHLFTGSTFRKLRDSAGAWLLAKDMTKVRAALELDEPEEVRA